MGQYLNTETVSTESVSNGGYTQTIVSQTRTAYGTQNKTDNGTSKVTGTDTTSENAVVGTIDNRQQVLTKNTLQTTNRSLTSGNNANKTTTVQANNGLRMSFQITLPGTVPNTPPGYGVTNLSNIKTT